MWEVAIRRLGVEPHSAGTRPGRALSRRIARRSLTRLRAVDTPLSSLDHPFPTPAPARAGSRSARRSTGVTRRRARRRPGSSGAARVYWLSAVVVVAVQAGGGGEMVEAVALVAGAAGEQAEAVMGGLELRRQREGALVLRPCAAGAVAERFQRPGELDVRAASLGSRASARVSRSRAFCASRWRRARRPSSRSAASMPPARAAASACAADVELAGLEADHTEQILRHRIAGIVLAAPAIRLDDIARAARCAPAPAPARAAARSSPAALARRPLLRLQHRLEVVEALVGHRVRLQIRRRAGRGDARRHRRAA